jgi:glycosyltransferase involved in cell wall biosynthesis
MKKYCTDVNVVLHDQRKQIPDPTLPESINCYHTVDMVEALSKMLKKIKPDIVQVEFLIMAKYVEYIDNIPVFYTEHDMSSIDFNTSFFDRHLDDEKIRFLQWCKILNFEKKILKRFNTVICVTQNDRKLLSEFLPETRSAVVHTGVDLKYFRPRPGRKFRYSRNLVYVGNFLHYPNQDAMRYFVDAIFPGISDKQKGIKLFIVGSEIKKNMFKSNMTNIEMTGEVKDVREYLWQADVFVAPIRLGGGIKGKILEAMACGIPVVANKESSIGLEGRNDENILVAEDERDFIEKTLRLLKDTRLKKRITVNARKLVENEYDWKKITGDLDSLYRSVL